MHVVRDVAYLDYLRHACSLHAVFTHMPVRRIQVIEYTLHAGAES